MVGVVAVSHGHLHDLSPLLRPLELVSDLLQPVPAVLLLAGHHGQGLHPVVSRVVQAWTGEPTAC